MLRRHAAVRERGGSLTRQARTLLAVFFVGQANEHIVLCRRRGVGKCMQISRIGAAAATAGGLFEMRLARLRPRGHAARHGNFNRPF